MIADADVNAADVTQTAYSELLKLAVEFVVEIDVGYSDCVVRVASSCRLRYDAMKQRHDFIVIATIPNSVYVAGVGLCDDFMFAKCLQLTDRPVRRLGCRTFSWTFHPRDIFSRPGGNVQGNVRLPTPINMYYVQNFSFTYFLFSSSHSRTL